jgi:hypothetical protein
MKGMGDLKPSRSSPASAAVDRVGVSNQVMQQLFGGVSRVESRTGRPDDPPAGSGRHSLQTPVGGLGGGFGVYPLGRRDDPAEEEADRVAARLTARDRAPRSFESRPHAAVPSKSAGSQSGSPPAGRPALPFRATAGRGPFADSRASGGRKRPPPRRPSAPWPSLMGQHRAGGERARARDRRGRDAFGARGGACAAARQWLGHPTPAQPEAVRPRRRCKHLGRARLGSRLQADDVIFSQQSDERGVLRGDCRRWAEQLSRDRGARRRRRGIVPAASPPPVITTL